MPCLVTYCAPWNFSALDLRVEIRQWAYERKIIFSTRLSILPKLRMLRDREHVTVYVDFLIVSNYSAYISCRRRIATGNDVTTKLCRANALNKIYSYQPNWTKVNYSSDIVLQIINSNCWLFSASDFINVIWNFIQHLTTENSEMLSYILARGSLLCSKLRKRTNECTTHKFVALLWFIRSASAMFFREIFQLRCLPVFASYSTIMPFPNSVRESDWVSRFNVPINTLSVISETSLTSRSLALVLTAIAELPKR